MINRLSLTALAGLMFSFGAVGAPLSNPQVDSYNVRVGTETFAALYQFTTNTLLVETAQAIQGLGSDVIKFHLGSDTSFQSGITLPPNINSLITLARDEPSYHKVFDMPFQSFVCWAYPFANSDSYWKNSYTTTQSNADYTEMYNLTHYLLTNYNNSGKTFYLGHWEGDGYLEPWTTNQPASVFQGMISWLNTRQKAVDDAKKATSFTNVMVYNYSECNRPRDAMVNGPNNNQRVINMVIPYVTNLDFVSYSSYDAQGLSAFDLDTTLNYIEAHTPTNKSSVIKGERLFIGEYGWGYDTPAVQEPLNRAYIQRLLGWQGSAGALPFVLFWEMYDNEVGKQYCLIDSNNVPTPSYPTFKNFLNDARMAVAQFNEANGRLPNDAEFSSVAIPILNAPVPDPIAISVSNGVASSVGPTQVAVSGTVAQGIYGDLGASVWVYWGRQDGGPLSSAWENSQFLGVNSNFNPHVYTVLLTNLAPNTNYFFRFYAGNITNHVWAASSGQFNTAELDPSAFDYRMRLTYSGYSGAEALTNFPALVTLSPALPGFSYSQFASPNGGDLRFAGADGLTPLPFEVDEWNTNGASVVWVQLSALDSSTNFIWAYWGNLASTNLPLTSTNGSVWLPSYDLVWHLEQTGFPYLDSSLQHSTLLGVAPASAAGIFGRAGSFNGTSSYLNAGPVNLGSAFTLSAWVNLSPSSTNIQAVWASKQGGFTSSGIALYVNSYNTSDGRLVLETSDGSSGQQAQTVPAMVTPGAWHWVAATINRTTGTARLYVDGVDRTQTSSAATDFPTQSALNLGRITNGVYYFKGLIDEARIQQGFYSSNWIHAAYLNAVSNATFAAVSPLNPQPQLTLTPGANGASLSWPICAGVFNLYATTNLTPPIDWEPVTNPPPSLVDGQWVVSAQSNSPGSVFYRLQAR